MNMETYLRRTYGQTKAIERDDFPFWDYRSRRGAFSSSNSSFTSSSSSCDGSSMSSVSSRSDTGSENISISDHSDTDSLLPFDQQKMSIQFITDTFEISTMENVYQPILTSIDPDLNILKIVDKSESLGNDITSLPVCSAQIPSLAIMVFLQEEGMVGFERVQTMKRHFEKPPWKFHHSEQVHRGAINPYPYNSQDFYYTSEDLPLWAVRQVHTGKQFFRTVLFVSDNNWQSMMQFYKLIIGREPDVKREDFCLFTISSFAEFDIQLALKKLQADTKPRILENVKLQFLVSDIGNIVSFLPNVCRPLSDNRWETTDNDGNVVVIETPRIHSNSTFSDRCSVSDRSSLSGGNSIRTRNSFNQNRPANNTPIMNDLCRRRSECRRPATVHEQRPGSFTGGESTLQKIKMDNMIYRENAMRAIKDRHFDMQRTHSGHNELGVENNMTDIKKPEPIKSFYV